jgi:hypothetical protein
MESLPAVLNLKIKSEPCSSLSPDNPRLHCPVCNILELSKSTEPLLSNNTKHHPSIAEKNRDECKKLTAGNSCLKNACSEDESNDECRTNVALNSTEKKQDLKTELHEDKDKNCDQTWNRSKNIQDYLEEHGENYEEFLVPENILKKKVLLMGKWTAVFCY